MPHKFKFKKCSCFPQFRKGEEGILKGKKLQYDRDLVTTHFQQGLQAKDIIDNKLAVEHNDRFFTYAQLDTFSSAIAKGLVTHVEGIKMENPDGEPLIAVCLPASERFVAIMFGILKLGAAYLPLNPDFPEELLLAIITKFGPLMVIIDDNSPIICKYDQPKFAQLAKIINVEEIWLDCALASSEIVVHKNQQQHRASVGSSQSGASHRENDDNKNQDGTKKILKYDSSPNISPTHFHHYSKHGKEDEADESYDRTAVVLYTSGSSKNPKGIRITHRAIINRCCFEWKHYSFTRNSNCALTSPVYSIESLPQIFVPLLKGASLYIFRKFDIPRMDAMIRKISQKSITRICLKPMALKHFLSELELLDRADTLEFLKPLKSIVCSGDPLSLDLAKWFFRIFELEGKVLSTFYGLPETSGHVVFENLRHSKELEKKILFGRLSLRHVMDNCKLFVLQDTLEKVGDAKQGEICLCGTPCVRFVNEKVDTDPTIITENPYSDSTHMPFLVRTGDFGRTVKLPDGKRRLVIEGREEKFLRNRDVKLSYEEFTELLDETKLVKQSKIMEYHPYDPHQKTIVAFIVLEEGNASNKAQRGLEIVRYLKLKIPDFLIPQLHLIDEFPLLKNGRVDIHSILDEFDDQKIIDPYHEWDNVKVEPSRFWAAKLLFEGMHRFAGIAIETSAQNLRASFFDIGGNSLTAISLLNYINRNGFKINLAQFLASFTLNDLINAIQDGKRKSLLGDESEENEEASFTSTNSSENKNSVVGHVVNSIDLELEPPYIIEILRSGGKTRALELISKAYSQNGELETLLSTTESEVKSYAEMNWSHIVKQDMSFCAMQYPEMKMVAVALNIDVTTPLKSVLPLRPIRDLDEELKKNFYPNPPKQEKETLKMVLYATDSTLSLNQSIQLLICLVKETIKKAQEAGYKNMFTITSNLFMRRFLLQGFNFEVIDDYQINEFIDQEGHKPFRLARNYQTASVLWIKFKE